MDRVVTPAIHHGRVDGERRSGPSAKRSAHVFTFVQAHSAKNELDFRVPFKCGTQMMLARIMPEAAVEAHFRVPNV
jgi:hypothetical protein